MAIKTISTYKEEIRALVESLGTIDAKATSEKRDLNKQELDLKNKVMDQIDLLRATVASLERQENTLTALATAPAPETLLPGSNLPALSLEVRDQDRFPSLGAQMAAVMVASIPGGTTDPRLRNIMNAATGLGTDVPSDGGFLVQTDFSTELMQQVYQTGILLSKVRRRIPITGNANGITINGFDETSRATGYRRGGIQVYWINEADTITPKKPKFRQIELKLRKVAGLVYLTSEMMQDAGTFEADIRQAFIDEIAYAVDLALWNGTGAAEPKGILGSNALVTVDAEDGQTAAESPLMAENIINMYSRMFASSMGTAEWYINQDVLPALFKMKIDIGTGGQLVYMPPSGLAGSPYGTLLGRPVNPIEQASSLGTKGDIVFADFSKGYVIADKGGVRTDVSIHVAFVTDQNCFKFVLRIDGQPILGKYVTPASGSTNYQSHFIALATR
jgi:HK97 family phage major capsid protein